MFLTTGSWIGLWIFSGAAFILLFVTLGLAIHGHRHRWSDAGFMALPTGFFCFMSLIPIIAFVCYGMSNSRAKADLEDAGFQVVSVATNGNTALVAKDGTRRVVNIYYSKDAGRYTAHVLCDYAPFPKSVNQCGIVPEK